MCELSNFCEMNYTEDNYAFVFHIIFSHWNDTVELTLIHTLWPNNAIWWHRFESTLAQAMFFCQMAPGHYLKQCCLLINESLWHSPESNFTVSAEADIQYNEFEHHTFEIIDPSPRGQWVKKRPSLSCIISNKAYDNQGPISLTIFCSQFKFDGNFALL